MAKRRTPKWLDAARKEPAAWKPAERQDWLERALARAGVLPPGEAEAAIRAGRVTVGDRVVREPLAFLRPGDPVRVDGRPVDLAARTVVLALHKPAGVVTAGSDPEGLGTVFDVLAAALPPDLRRHRWHAIGRLDRDTTGLLLFTNDERLVGHGTSPAAHLPKTYRAVVGADVSDDRLVPLRAGLVLDDGPCRPAFARAVGPREVELTITEGRHHQVKRMLAAVGLPVLRLHRAAVGALVLDVPERALRRLSDAEVRDALRFDPVARAPLP
jgi:23S rRNA pseudouridine2605 synthase/16S rRNA pseudouridine516 synthase